MAAEVEASLRRMMTRRIGRLRDVRRVGLGSREAKQFRNLLRPDDMFIPKHCIAYATRRAFVS